MKRSMSVLFAFVLSLVFLLAPMISEARGGRGGHGGGGGHSSGFHGGFHGGFYAGPRYYGGSVVYFGSYYPPLSSYSPGYYPDPYYYSGPPADYYPPPPAGGAPPASYYQPPPAASGGAPPAYPPPPAGGTPPATPQKSVVVAVDLLNVRSGPSMDRPVVAQVPRGVALPVLGSTQGWWYVQLPNNTTGWVQSQFTTDTKQPPALG